MRRLFKSLGAAAVALALMGASLVTQTGPRLFVSSGSDGTPSAFTFTDQTSVALSSTITSAGVTISGIDTTITCSNSNGTLDVGADGTFSSSRSVVSGNSIRARHTSSASNSTAVNSPVTCGGVSDTFTSTTLASGGSATGDIFDDTFEDRATGAVSLVTAWTSKGYDSLNNDGTVEITNRAGMPATVLASPFLSASKTRALHIQHSGNEGNNRIRWTGIGAGIREVYVSWWEYRPNRNLSGEKFLRIGNFSGGSRKLDIILTYSGLSGSTNSPSVEQGNSTLIANSGLMFDYGDQGYGEILPDWSDKLYHIEVRLKLATSTNSDGIFQVWVDGTQVASSTGLRMFLTSGDATAGIELIEVGGWPSEGGESWVTYPIDRWYPGGWKVSTTRLGVWNMNP